MTEGRIIYNPSESVMKMFYRKMNAESREELKSRKFDAVGLLQTTVAGVLSVSYTHLDVYKRQASRRSRVRISYSPLRAHSSAG